MTAPNADPTTVHQAPLAPDLPSAPREVTKGVRRTATFEPRVRFWFVLAAVVLLIATYLSLVEATRWSADRALVLHGEPVKAKILQMNGIELKRRDPWTSVLRLSFPGPNGSDQIVEGQLHQKPLDATGKPLDLISVGDELPIRYDKENPARWTDSTATPPIANALFGAYILLPIMAGAGLIGFWQRSRILASYASGDVVPAAVVSVASSPIAPGYSRVGAAPSKGRGQTADAVTVFVPHKRGKPMRGDVIWILVPPKSGPALAAAAFS